MISISRISEGLTEKIKTAFPDIDKQKAETIEYGIYMAISEVIKIVLIILISIILKITKYVVVTIPLFGMLRLYIGGIHADTHIKCFITTALTMLSIPLFCINIRMNNLILAAAAFPFCLIAIYKYAPADNPNKPVKSKKQRKALRIKGFILITLYFAISIFLPYKWANIIICTSIIACVMTTPALYRLYGNKYSYEEVKS